MRHAHLSRVMRAVSGAVAEQQRQGHVELFGGGKRFVVPFLAQNNVAGKREREVEEDEAERRAPPVCSELERGQ